MPVTPKKTPKKKVAPKVTTPKVKYSSEPIPEPQVLYLKLNTGEELVSIVEKPAVQIAKLMESTLAEPDSKKRRAIIKELNWDFENTPAEMMELHYPSKITYVPTQKGIPAIVLLPWISTTISSNQVFRVSVANIITMSQPDAGLIEYYRSVMQRVIISIAMRLHATNPDAINDPDGSVMKQINNLKKAIEQEQEDYEDGEIAEILTKAKTKPVDQSDASKLHSLGTPSAVASGASNTVPSIIVGNEKKTLH